MFVLFVTKCCTLIGIHETCTQTDKLFIIFQMPIFYLRNFDNQFQKLALNKQFTLVFW